MKLISKIKQINSKPLNYILLFFVISAFQVSVYFLFNSDLTITLRGDAKLYIGYLENLYRSGSYQFSGQSSGRMPGFLPIYIPFRFFFSQTSTLWLMLIGKLLFYSFSVVFFAKNVGRFFNWSNLSIILLTLLLGFSNYVTHFGNVFYTESLAISCLLVSIGFLAFKTSSKPNTRLFLSGLFFTWLIFLRPFFIAILLIFIIYIVIRFKGVVLKSLFLFLISFVIIDGIWITRNYLFSGKPIFLQESITAGSEFTDAYKSYRNMISKLGGDHTEWNPKSVGMWFQTNEFLEKNGFERPPELNFPDFVFTEEITLSKMEELRSLYWKSFKDPASEKSFVRESAKIVEDFRSKKPFHYYISTKLNLVRLFIFHPFTYYLSMNGKFHYPQLIVKSGIYLLNAGLFIIGYLLCFLHFWKSLKRFQPFHLLLLSTPLFLVLLFPIYLGSVEYRMISMGLPFLAFSIACTTEQYRRKVIEEK